MPTLERQLVPALHVRKDDAIVNVVNSDSNVKNGKRLMDKGLTVSEVRRSIKNVTFLFGTEDLRLVVDKDATVAVTRLVDTPEEKAAKEHEYELRSLKWRVNLDEIETFVGYVHDEIDKRVEWNEIFDWGNLGGILQKQAWRKLLMEIRFITTNEKIVQNVSNEDEKLFQAVAAWYAQYVLLDRMHTYPKDPLSRSTSVLSNLFEDLDRWAKEKLADDLRYLPGLRARAQEMVDAWNAEH